MKLAEILRSVGIIGRDDGTCGTGFRVGDDKIMTASHVLYALLGTLTYFNFSSVLCEKCYPNVLLKHK